MLRRKISSRKKHQQKSLDEFSKRRRLADRLPFLGGKSRCSRFASALAERFQLLATEKENVRVLFSFREELQAPDHGSRARAQEPLGDPQGVVAGADIPARP